MKKMLMACLLSSILLASMTLPVMGSEERMELCPVESYVSERYATENSPSPVSASFYELNIHGVTPNGDNRAWTVSPRVTLTLTVLGSAPTVRDASTVYNREDLGASIQHGGLILDKRVGNEREFSRVATLVNLFEDNPNGIPDLYVFSSSDLHEGVTLRITVLYATRDEPPLRHTDVYEITVIRPDWYVSLRMDNGMSDLCDGGTVTEGNGILCEMGRDVGTVEMSYNDGAFVWISDGTRVGRIGRYRFRWTTRDGTVICKTVYIIPSANRAMAEYFPDGAVQGIYLFDEHAEVPTYLKGATLTIPAAPPFLPALSGQMINHETGEVRELPATDTARFIPLEAGSYTVTLTAGEALAGVTDLFTFRFHVWEHYVESVNHRHLKTTYMEVPHDFCLLRADTDRAVAIRTTSDGEERREMAFGVPLTEQLQAGDWTVQEFQDDVLLDVYRIHIPQADAPASVPESESTERLETSSCRSSLGYTLLSLIPTTWIMRKRKER